VMAGAAASQRTAAVPAKAPGAARLSLSEWFYLEIGRKKKREGLYVTTSVRHLDPTFVFAYKRESSLLTTYRSESTLSS